MHDRRSPFWSKMKRVNVDLRSRLSDLNDFVLLFPFMFCLLARPDSLTIRAKTEYKPDIPKSQYSVDYFSALKSWMVYFVHNSFYE